MERDLMEVFKDMQAFVEYWTLKKDGMPSAGIYMNLVHDIAGIVDNKPEFLPRSDGYAALMRNKQKQMAS